MINDDNNPIRVALVDDHKVFRQGLRSILENHTRFSMVGDAAGGDTLLQILKQQKVDVVLMDINLGKESGIDWTKLIKEHFPGIKIVGLSMHDESKYILKMIEMGAEGYLIKDSGMEEIIEAIETVHKGETYFRGKVSNLVLEKLRKGNVKSHFKKDIPLTPREKEVLKLIAEEYTNQEIAEELFISLRTVETHKRNLIEKLDVKNTAGLVKYAIAKGIISTD